jgi:cytochrome c-type biogenesis protein CcmH
MIWAMVIGLGLVVFAALALLFKVPRYGLEPIGAALALGLAGFAVQAHPTQPGAPKSAEQRQDKAGPMLVEARKALYGSTDSPNLPNRWLLTADAMTRHGQYGDAAAMVLGAVETNPQDSEAWVALGNNLVGHAEGVLTPAAMHAYRKAAEADPTSPGPGYFLGLALITNGKLAEGRAIWAELVARAPSDAAWRGELEERIKRLDQIAAMQQAQ